MKKEGGWDKKDNYIKDSAVITDSHHIFAYSIFKTLMSRKVRTNR